MLPYYDLTQTFYCLICWNMSSQQFSLLIAVLTDNRHSTRRIKIWPFYLHPCAWRLPWIFKSGTSTHQGLVVFFSYICQHVNYRQAVCWPLAQTYNKIQLQYLNSVSGASRVICSRNFVLFV